MTDAVAPADSDSNAKPVVSDFVNWLNTYDLPPETREAAGWSVVEHFGSVALSEDVSLAQRQEAADELIDPERGVPVLRGLVGLSDDEIRDVLDAATELGVTAPDKVDLAAFAYVVTRIFRGESMEHIYQTLKAVESQVADTTDDELILQAIQALLDNPTAQPPQQ